MKRLLGFLRAALPDKVDLHLYGGAALVAFGVGTYSRPVAMIVLGLALLAFAYWRPE